MGEGPTTRRRIAIARSYRRIAVAFEVGGFRGAGRIRKLSREGFFVSTGSLPKPGREVRVVIHDPHEGRDIEVRGSVRWNTEQLNPRRSGFGVHLESATPGYTELYERLLLT